MTDQPTAEEARPLDTYATDLAMFELSRIRPHQHVIDKIAASVIRSARLGAELLDGHAIRLPKASDVWSESVWEALLDKYLDGELPEDARYAVYLLRADIVDAAVEGEQP